MKKLKVEILENKKIGLNYFLMNLRCKYIASRAIPGQFIHVRIEARGGRPFLRRPFSIHSVKNKDTFQVLYEIVGKGTKILSGYKKGENLDVIGPLGNGFETDDKADNLLVAGGMGVAPLLFLARHLNKTNGKKKNFLFLGAKSEKKLIGKKHFEKLNIKTFICTEDGSCGKKGTVMRLVEEFLRKNPSLKVTGRLFGCGPVLMLKSLIELAGVSNMECQVSVEEIFACGVGACLGCAVKTGDGYKLACKDGPVFKGDSIIL